MATLELIPVEAKTDACCDSMAAEPISESEAADLTQTLKALADPARIRILSIVAAHAEQEACVCDLQEPLGLSQPTVSHHLKVLTNAGFLTRTQRASWAYYKLVPGSLDAIAAHLVSI